jgi:hypothetical protein
VHPPGALPASLSADVVVRTYWPFDSVMEYWPYTLAGSEVETAFHIPSGLAVAARLRVGTTAGALRVLGVCAGAEFAWRPDCAGAPEQPAMPSPAASAASTATMNLLFLMKPP